MEKIYTFKFPDIGEGVVEGEVVEWLKKVGDTVTQDEPVVSVMTDKATVELPAPYPGIIHKQYYKEGEVAVKDKPLYDIQVSAEENLPKVKSLAPQLNTKPSLEKYKPLQKTTCTYAKAKAGPCLALPKVRHLAKQLDIDIDNVSGSGPEGRITEEDLKQASHEKKQVTPLKRYEDDEELPLVGIKGLMAKKMHHSQIPQFSYFEQVEVTRLIQLRQKFKSPAADQGIKLSFMPFFIKALSLVSTKYPLLNSFVDMSTMKVVLHKQHNIGIAIAMPQGLIVPVLKGVQEMNLEQIIQAYESLKSKALAGKASPEEMRDATITISNFGVLGDGMWATPMISAPEVAILGLAQIQKMPIVKDDQVVVRDVLRLSWSFDHRIIDGALAAQISHDYGAILKDPAAML